MKFLLLDFQAFPAVLRSFFNIKQQRFHVPLSLVSFLYILYDLVKPLSLLFTHTIKVENGGNGSLYSYCSLILSYCLIYLRLDNMPVPINLLLLFRLRYPPLSSPSNFCFAHPSQSRDVYINTVSYTHLDVYKRQVLSSTSVHIWQEGRLGSWIFI